tara:strand:+ start:1166 stop:1642 length:477 start_codon:yes stop_codon:yes gene_type:complete
MKKIKVIIFTLFYLISTGCGFKVIEQSKIKNYEILEIREEGDKKINFFIKNELYNLLDANDSSDQLAIDISTKKTKVIKEKNEKNQITKYNIEIISLVKLNFIDKGVTKTIKLKKDGFYNVDKNHTITRDSQKSTEKNLNDKLSEELSTKIFRIINEF